MSGEIISYKRVMTVEFLRQNVDCTEGLKKENVAFSLCKFIPEITKVKDGGPYPGSTLYQFVVSIQ